MVTTDARDALLHRLTAVFAEETFSGLYDGFKAPKISLGFPTNEPPFFVAIDEVIDNMTSTGGATMGHSQREFTLRVWLCARHTDLKTASDTLAAYIDAVFNSVDVDRRLNFTVDNCQPEIETAGTSADSSKRCLAAASVAIRCQVFTNCPERLKEVVNASNN